MSLKKRTLKASSVLLVGHAATQLLSFAGNLITTRILAPELFGVMAIANALVAIVRLLTDLGFTLSVIRSEHGDDPTFLKAVFTLKAIQSSIIFCLLLIFSAILYTLQAYDLLKVGSTWAHPDLPIAVLIIAFASFMTGFRSIQYEVHVRKQQLISQIVLNFISQLCAIAFIILSGLQQPSIFSLAFANIVGSTVIVLGSYLIYTRECFGFSVNRAHLKEIFRFGKWLTASSGVVAVTNNIDKFLLGYFLTTPMMGVYSIAFLMFTALDGVFVKLNTTLFSALSEVIRDTPQKLSATYYRIRFYRDLLIAAPACILLTNGDFAVELFFDERYVQAGPFLQLMSFAFLIECFLFKHQAITAMGNSKVSLKISSMRLLSVIVLAPFAWMTFGVYGVILVIACRKIIGSWTLFKIFSEKSLLNIRYELRTLALIVSLLLVGAALRYVLSYLNISKFL